METNKNIEEVIAVESKISTVAEEVKAEINQIESELDIDMNEELKRFDEEMIEIDAILGTYDDIFRELKAA